MKKLKNILLYGIGAFVLTFYVGCGSSGNDGANSVGGNLVSSQTKIVLDSATALNAVKNIVPDATMAFPTKAVKLIYKTKNEDGVEVNASSILVYPDVDQTFLENYKNATGKDFSISLIENNHGTIFLNSEAPSNEITDLNSSTFGLSVLMTSYAGFAVVMPDYLGYGDSNRENHPYILKRSAQDSYDALKAAVRYMIDNGIIFNGQVFITGYSEGGYVTMAEAQMIEQEHSGEFNLKAIAPMAGPYDIEALGAYDLNASMKMVYPAFLAYIADSYSKAYDDVSIDDIAVKPDVFKNVDLFGGDYDTVPIHVALGLADPAKGDYGFYTHYTDELFKDSFINDYQNNLNNPLRVRFKENSVYNWAPKTKVNLIQCLDDEIIPFKFASLEAYNTMKANGADVNLTAIPTDILTQQVDATHPFVHANCASTAYGAAVKWFSQIRSGEIK